MFDNANKVKEKIANSIFFEEVKFLCHFKVLVRKQIS